MNCLLVKVDDLLSIWWNRTLSRLILKLRCIDFDCKEDRIGWITGMYAIAFFISGTV